MACRDDDGAGSGTFGRAGSVPAAAGDLRSDFAEALRAFCMDVVAAR
jgi:hypothetical protein